MQDAREAVSTAADGTPIAWTRYNPRQAGIGGPGGRVLLVHALAMDRSNWDAVIAALPARAEAIAVDCRGHGRSGTDGQPYSVEAMADDLATVLDAAGWADAVVAGCSMGGCIAQAFAARHPRRCTGLALIDTTAWYGPEGAANWAARAAKARREGLESLLPFQRERWFGEAFRRDHPQRVAAAERVFLANDIDAYAASCAMLGAADLRPFLAGLRLPVSVLVGSEDHATPPEAARALAAAIPGAQLTILEGARHFTPIECPHEIAGALAALLEPASQGAGA